MEKRLIAAIALSLLVLVSWSVFVSKTQPIAVKDVTEEKPIMATGTTVAIPSTAPKQATPFSFTALDFKNNNVDVIFDEENAAIKEVSFKNYKDGKIILGDGFALNDSSLVFHKELFNGNMAIFAYRDKNKEIIKRFIFSNSNYGIDLEIETHNLSNLSLDINWSLILGELNFAGNQDEARFQSVAIANKDKVHHLNGRKNFNADAIQFLGLSNRYFSAILQPEQIVYSAAIEELSKERARVSIKPVETSIAPNRQVAQKFRIYLGPQHLQSINKVNSEWSIVMHYRTFNFIAHLLLQLLEFIYGIVHNWGWVLVMLSALIYLILFPLTLKQMRSMKEMQAIQPRVEELRKAYKDNPQRLNKEIMQLYKDHKVNPLGGCLPLILQIPVFFALYQVLMRSVALKGAQFLWIKDLSQPDSLFMLPVSLPIVGNEFNILPLAMAAEMFFQQKMSMSTAAGGSKEQQKIMLILFPIMFGLIFYKMPSGLVLYWFINSTLMLAYQWRISKQK